MGFTFDDAAAKGGAESLATMRALIEKDPRIDERIFPYIGGEEVNTDPRHAHHRYVIDFDDFPLRREAMAKSWAAMTEHECEEALRKGIVPTDYPGPVAADWPALLSITEARVRPTRALDNRPTYRNNWWRYAERRSGLYTAIAPLKRVLAINCGACPHMAFVMLEAGSVYANTIDIIASQNYAFFAVLQSRVHEVWARFFSSSMKDDLRYAPSDCFRTFPFPETFETDGALEVVGEAYHAFRAQLMIDRNEGLTKTYNFFHARSENAPDIGRLRALHAEMDAAVLRAYGWDDLADRAAPEFIEQDADEGKTPKARFDWLSEFKDEVLARLLALNSERAAAERAVGLTAPPEDDEEELEEEGEDA
jgi:hypothetical protein